MGPQAVANAFSVDVEDYYQVLNFQGGIDRSEWGRFEARVEANTRRILDLLDELSVKGTFFCLGLVAEENPKLVPAIAERGHEIASHGWSHTPLTRLDPDSFLEEARRSREILEAQSGQDVIGFRAPSFSIVERTRWALDVLLEAGYRYDSSMFPVSHPDYGVADLPFEIHRQTTPAGESIVEWPMTVVRAFGKRIPVSGGGYFRLLPYALTRWGLRRANREGRSAMFYVHPWEVDPEQPDLREHTSRLGAFRHYTGLKRTEARLRRLFQAFAFTSCREVLEKAGYLDAPSTSSLAGVDPVESVSAGPLDRPR